MQCDYIVTWNKIYIIMTYRSILNMDYHSGWILNSFVLFLIYLPEAMTWHDLSNTDFHCWPLSANAQNPQPFPSCPGIHIHWIEAPPDEIKVFTEFNVSYELNLATSFYSWAVDSSRNIFAGVGISDAAAAQTWCETTACPTSASDATQINCCIHHVNVHTCPLDEIADNNGLCGPWIPASGSIFTHSNVLIGNSLVSNWSSHVSGLYAVGQTSLIAHFKVAGMHVALEKKITVLPRTVCGDGLCEDLEGENCSVCPSDCGGCPLEPWKVAVIAVFVIAVLTVVIILVAKLQWQKYKLLWDESWIIPFKHLEQADHRAAWGSFIGSMISLSVSNTTKSGNTQIAQSALQQQIFVKTVNILGRTVALKEIHKNQFSLTKTIRMEVKEIRAMDHQNLCRFIGGCIEVPNVCILTEYCPKGSLNDVLLNDDVPLSWAFRFSFVTDIARGMAYLHSRKICHGRLKSNNCVIDDRWTVKISDYGLPTYRHADPTPGADKLASFEDRRNQVYLPPEVKEGYSPMTPPGDVYAFSIILVEVATRNGPHGDNDPDSVEDNWKPPLPEIDDESGDNYCPASKSYLQLITECWDFHPVVRPTFDIAKKCLHRMNPDKLSPVDMMMNMMEKYSKHLETIVNERTQDLMAEKQKTDRLLYSMLPKPIADKLRIGRPIDAEMFQSCTIYFSDIVGFTAISGDSTPIQVVTLLNKLYTCFDSVIDEYNVYKVETIGDAYMVVSGVPLATPFHSKQIALMALDLVKESKNFIIPHKHKEALRIRVGIHTGPVCAGVVGLKMPRYCLFGDTVNTASRMESNGEAYKIHASNTTYESLVTIGGFTFEARGTVAIKGKGEMRTWWITGRQTQGTFSDDKPDDCKLSGTSTSSFQPGTSVESVETNETLLPGSVFHEDIG